MAKKNFPLLLSPSLWQTVLGSFESPVLGLIGIDLSLRAQQKWVRKVNKNPLPVPFPISCEEYQFGCANVCWTDRSKLGFQVEEEREAQGLHVVRRSGRPLMVPGDTWGQGSEPQLTDTYLIRVCVCTCVHPCPCTFTLSMCLSLVACLLALHAGSRVVLNGSSLFSMLLLLPLSLWRSGSLGKAPHSSAGLGMFLSSAGLVRVSLASGLSVIIGYIDAVTQVVWLLGFPGPGLNP